MVNRNAAPTPCFWNFAGLALFIFALGLSISMARTEALELEIARYKLKTGVALTKVQKATESVPIATQAKQEIDRVIDEAEQEVDEKVSKLENEDD